MATSKVTYIYDADNSFRAPGSVAITSTAIVGELALDKLTGARGDMRDKLGAQWYNVVIAISANDDADGDETYVFDVQVGAVGSPSVKVGEFAVPRGTVGQVVMKLDAATIEQLDPADHEVIELNITMGGTSPSMTFAAWLV